MMQIVEQTQKEKVKMYMKCTKKELIQMLIACNDALKVQITTTQHPQWSTSPEQPSMFYTTIC